MRARLALAAGAAATAGLGLAAAAFLLRTTPEPRGAGEAAPLAGPALAAARPTLGLTRTGVGSAPVPTPLPRSLRGTEVDGELLVDADGRFVPSPEARRLFDHFLAASGEEPPATLRARIAVEIRARLAPPAAAEAESLLDRYLAYREAVRDLFERGQAPDDLERRFQWLRELRRGTLGAADAQALFADEDERIARELERRRIALDPELSAAERAGELDAFAEARPSTAHLALARDEAALREAGASAAEIHALRAERFGDDAAARLDALDARRAEWQARLALYRTERDALVAQTPGDPAARAAALDALRGAHFSESEARRAAALDRIDGIE